MSQLKFLSLILFLSVAVKSYGQDGYTLTVNTTHAKDKTLVLSYFGGSPSKKSRIDSVSLTSEKQSVTFKNSKKIIGAIYQLSFKSEPKNAINVVLDNGTKQSFELDGGLLQLLKPQQQLNKDFVFLQTYTDNKKVQLEALSQNYPKSVVALYAKLELKKLEANTAKTSVNNTLSRDSYFAGLDLQDKRIPLLPNIYSYLNSYTSMLPITDTNYKSAVDLLFKNTTCSSRNYIFYLDWIFKNLAFYQQYNLNETYKYVYTKYLNKEVCKQRDSKFYSKISDGYKELTELPIGSTIPDFQLADSLAKLYTIKSLYTKSKYTFIAFYDPDCEHCKQIIPKVVAYMDSKHLDTAALQKIAFINSKDLSSWHSFINEKGLKDWFNVQPKKGDMDYFIKLKVFVNPKFFLVNNEGIILLKSFNTTALDAILKGQKF